MNKVYQELKKRVWHVGNQTFGCEIDAISELKKLNKELKYFEVTGEVVKVPYYLSKGRPKANTEPRGYHYKISATIVSCLQKIRAYMNRLGRFILATNILNKDRIRNEDILKQYKEQTHIEASFKFIKNDAFELDSLFLKTQSRIVALMMVMTICLIVYNFAQCKLRTYLKKNDGYLPSQLGKPV